MYICSCNNKMSAVSMILSSIYGDKDVSKISLSFEPFCKFHILLSLNNTWVNKEVSNLRKQDALFRLVCPKCFGQIIDDITPVVLTYEDIENISYEDIANFYYKYFDISLGDYPTAKTDEGRNNIIINYLNSNKKAYSIFKDINNEPVDLYLAQLNQTQLIVDYDEFIELYDNKLSLDLSLPTKELVEINKIKRYLFKYV